MQASTATHSNNTPTYNGLSKDSSKREVFDHGRRNDIGRYPDPNPKHIDHFLAHYPMDSVEQLAERVKDGMRPNKDLFEQAVGQAYLAFDPARYLRAHNDPEDDTDGIVTKLVWWHFRELERKANPLKAEKRRREAERKAEEEKKARQRAFQKNQEKERREMERLGGGDLERGRRRFNERMHRDKAAKLSKPVTASLDQERKFGEWWSSSEGAKWHRGMQDSSSASFARTGSYTRPRGLLVEQRAKTGEDLIETLDTMRRLPKASSLSLKVTLEWSAVRNPERIPTPHVCPGGSISLLQNRGRLSSPHTFETVGVLRTGGVWYLVSSETCREVYRLFPKEYAQFESRNPRVGAPMRVLYRLHPEAIVGFEAQGPKFRLRAMLAPTTGRAAMTKAELQQALFPDPAQLASDDRVFRLEREKAARARRAREAGLRKAEQAKRRAQLAAEQSKPDLAADLDTLLRLKGQGVLSDEQFARSAAALSARS